MEWATKGISLGGRFAVELLLADKGSEIVELGELGNRGLPKPAKIKRRVVVTDFSSWAPGATQEYLDAFSLKSDTNGHQVFEFRDGNRRYLVPALALMRGFFRPHRYVLSEMFRPQALETICQPVVLGNTCTIVPTRNWPAYTRQQTLRSILEPLAWMNYVPSARHMCGSIHEHMLSGMIGMCLPRGKIRVSIRCFEIGTVSHVTELTVVTLDTDELPLPFAGEQPTHIAFHEGVKAAEGRVHRQSIKDETLRCHPDGSTDISDDEWTVLRRFAYDPRGNAYQRHEPRLLLDGILRKLITGTPWQKTNYKIGNWVNAQSLYEKLKRTGKWEKICTTLRELRSLSINIEYSVSSQSSL
ncbi:MAG: transposase [Rhodocyclaceae bacterium]|nr:transposase [Rhodocyclaceae bacterium]